MLVEILLCLPFYNENEIDNPFPCKLISPFPQALAWCVHILIRSDPELNLTRNGDPDPLYRTPGA